MITDRVKTITSGDNFSIDCPLPKTAKIELSAVCNNACDYCTVRSTRPIIPFMEFDTWKKCLEECYKIGIEEIGIFFMGESTLHPEFEKFFLYLKENYSMKTYITTNGTKLGKLMFLVENGCDSIKFSLNGYDEESQHSMTGHNTFKQINDNLKTLIQYRDEIGSKTEISASSIYWNNSIQDDYVKELIGIVDDFFYLPFYNHAGAVMGKNISYDNVSISLMRGTNTAPCYGLFKILHIKANGMIHACRFGVDNEMVIGNINNGIENAWNSNMMKEYRKSHLENNLYSRCSLCLKG